MTTTTTHTRTLGGFTVDIRDNRITVTDRDGDGITADRARRHRGRWGPQSVAH